MPIVKADLEKLAEDYGNIISTGGKIMRVKKLKVCMKSIKTALSEFTETGEAVEREEVAKEEIGVHFTDFEEFRKALTPKRLELLHVIKTERPHSINQLSKIVKRDIKNVAEDVKYLVQIGLVERKETGKEVTPVVSYDKISLKIAI